MTIKTLVSTNLTDTRPQIFASKSDGTIATMWKVSRDPDSAWTPWQLLLGPPPRTSMVSAGTLSNGANQLFALADMPGPPGPEALTAWKVSNDPNAQWSNWVGLGYDHATYIAAGTLQDGRMQFFVIQDGAVKSQWKVTTDPSSPFSAVQDMTPNGLPALISLTTFHLSDGRLQLIGPTSNGLITTWKQDDNPNAAWTPWQEFQNTPQTRSSIGVAWAPLTDRRPQLWSYNRFGDVHSCWKVSTNPNDAWTPWQPFPGTPPNIVAFTAVPLQDRRPQLFAWDGQNISTTWKETADPNAAWVAWQRFPAP
jgi:hypothetical protein